MKLKSLLVCLMSLVWANTAFATGATLTVGSAYYSAGGTMTVPITLVNNGASISILSMDINYDTTKFSAPVGTVGAVASTAGKSLYSNVLAATGTTGTYRLLIAGGTTVDVNNPKGGTMTDVAAAGTSSLIPDGIVATVKFTVAAGVTGAITLSGVPDASDASANAVAINGAFGTINPGKVGDCNGDGKISVADLTYAINIILKKPGFVYNSLCDVNMVAGSGVVTPDGKTTIADVTTLVNVLIKKAGWILP